MKAIKTIANIALIIALCVAAYMIFFSHPGKVKEIMKQYENQKKDFESKILEYEADAVQIEKKVKKQEAKIIEAETRYSEAEADRLQWKEKYQKLRQSPIKKPDDIKTLKEAKIEIGKLTFRLGECNTGIEKTEDSLAACNALTLELEAQKVNLIEKYANLELKSNEQAAELIKRDATIQALKKVSSKINLKKALIYAGITIAAVKLIQLLIPRSKK